MNYFSFLDAVLSLDTRDGLVLRRLGTINQAYGTRFPEKKLEDFSHGFFDTHLCTGALLMDLDRGKAAVVHSCRNIEVFGFEHLLSAEIVPQAPGLETGGGVLRINLASRTRTSLDIPFSRQLDLEHSIPRLHALKYLHQMRKAHWPQGESDLLFA